MFTSNAQNARYVFLLTNTDPQGSKHKNLTMFLVPLDTPGIEIQAIRTLDGDRTNIVYYSDVRVDDLYRIGEVNGGWTVMRSALDSEHGIVDPEDHGLQYIAAMSAHGDVMAEVVDTVAALVAEVDDGSVKYRLGRSFARMEAALSTPGMFGRVAIAQTMRDISPDLMDILGTASVLPAGTRASATDGAAEHLYRLALPVGIYGGTLEVFRNMIAQHTLKLGRPSYG
jgi:alkylation response protein AidB-like acyl-CoA dehydrogenase